MSVSAVTTWLLTYLLHSTVALGGLWLFFRFAGDRASPELRDLMWKTALLATVGTAVLHLSTGVGWRPLPAPASGVERPAHRSLPSARDAEGAEGTGGPPAPEAEGTPRAGAPGSGPPSGASARPETSSVGARRDGSRHPTAAASRAARWIPVGWLFGALLMVAVRERRRRRFLRALGKRKPAEEPAVLTAARGVARELGLRRNVRITRSSVASSPLVVGPGEICLPERMTRAFPADQLRSLLGHELAHVRRRDPRWLRLAGWVEALFFFQPLNRVARRRLHEAAEDLCDDMVARRLGLGRALARTLVDVADRLVDPRPKVSVAGIAAERGSRLSRRVERLLEAGGAAPATGSRGARLRRYGLAAGLVASVLVAVPGFRPEPPDLRRTASSALSPGIRDSSSRRVRPERTLEKAARRAPARRTSPASEAGHERGGGAGDELPWRVLAADVTGSDRAVALGRKIEGATGAPGVVARLLELLRADGAGLYLQVDGAPELERIDLVADAEESLASVSLERGDRISATLGAPTGDEPDVGVLHIRGDGTARSHRLHVPARPFRLTVVVDGEERVRAVPVDLAPGAAATVRVVPGGSSP